MTGLYFLLPIQSDIYPLFLGLFTAQFLLYFLLMLRAIHGETVPLAWVLLVAVISRVILCFTEPILENDYWRYLWDGRVLAHGLNPYLYPPNSHALDPLGTTYRAFIGWPQFATIYPPLSEIVFSISHLLAPDSLFMLKFIFVLFDLGTGWLVLLWLRERGVNPSYSLLYFLNPLVLKEIANSAHVDSLAVFLCTLSMYLFAVKERRGLAWGVLALATCSKVYPLTLLPLFARLDKQWKKHLLTYGLTIALLYLPFLSAGTALFAGTRAFGDYWIFNASVFQVVNWVTHWSYQALGGVNNLPILATAFDRDYLAKIIVAALFLLWTVRATLSLQKPNDLPRAALSVLGGLLILSPVVNAWYVLWVLPFAVLERNIPWLTFTYLVIAAYSWFDSKGVAPYYRGAEYSALACLLIWFYYRRQHGSEAKEYPLSLRGKFRAQSAS